MPDGDELHAYEVEIRVADAVSRRTIHGEIRSEADDPQSIAESVEQVLGRHYGERRWRRVDPER